VLHYKAVTLCLIKSTRTGELCFAKHFNFILTSVFTKLRVLVSAFLMDKTEEKIIKAAAFIRLVATQRD
jgi:hypothetical protein